MRLRKVTIVLVAAAFALQSQALAVPAQPRTPAQDPVPAPASGLTPEPVPAQASARTSDPASAQASSGTPGPAPTRSLAAASAMDEVDAVVEQALREWGVPGLALAIVVDGDVVVCKGYGSRHAESRLPVTSSTLFPIASLTKPFTALLMGSLVDEGILAWDRPVVEYLPDFRLHDPERTRAVTLRDLMTHQSGLPRHDFVWYGSDLSRRDLYRRLRYLEPSGPLRGEWQYQNLMFMTAGYLAEAVTGSSWEQLVRERILGPLAMDDSTFSLRQLKHSADIAFPYAEGNEGARRVRFRSMDAVGPAGSINASAEELARFVAMLSSRGRHAGDTVVSPAVIDAMLEPQVELPEDAIDPAIGASHYGLGLVLSTYGDRRLAHHEGGVDGFVSLMSLLPDANAGVVVLTNYSGDNPVPWVVTRTIYDRLLQQPPRDWVAYARDTHALRQSTARSVPVTTGPVGSWRQGGYRPLPVDYAGSYWHPAYGEVDIVLDGDDLVLRFHGIDATLEPAGRRRFRVADGSLAGLSVTFFGNAMRRIDWVAIPWEPEVSDIVFVRRATADGGEDAGS